MTDPLRELYQEVILDHNRRPRNRREMPEATHSASGDNPLCGDCVTVHLLVEGDTIVDASFVGVGCAISTASASILTEMVKGKSPAEATRLFERFHSGVMGREEADLGEATALLGVREFPMRVKCATLAWHALEAALSGSPKENR
jgi:nitrogen fixation NifU-like protein